MKILRLFCVIVVVLMSSGTARAAAARVSFDGLEQSFLAGRYEQAVAEADRLIDSRAYPRDEIYYLKGISELKLKKFEEARNSFNEIISKQPQSKRAFDAYLGTGDA